MPPTLPPRPRPLSRLRSGRRLSGALGVLLVAGSLGVIGSTSTAQAATTISPTEAGSPYRVVRDDSVSLSVDSSGLSYYRSNASGTFAARTGATVLTGVSVPFLNTTCLGDNPAGTNLSPRATLSVTGPSGATVLSQVSPVRDISLGGAVAKPSYPPRNPQPGPANTNYRGDLPDSGAVHGMTATLDLSGKPAGLYTVTTTTTNMVRTGSTCTVGTPGADGKSVVAGPVVDVQTFEYRPWQRTFTDVFGGGKVRANITPREFAWSVGSKRTGVHEGTSTESFYSLDGNFPLPSDPTTCASSTGCLPADATACDPASGCVPRLMVIDAPSTDSDPDSLVGVFDLDTLAFIASAKVGGSSRIMASLGTDNDAMYHATLQQLSDQAATQGIDLPTLLATQVIVRDGQDQTSLSLLNGLQLDPSTTRGGIHLSSASTVQAGVLLDIYSNLRLTGGTCAANSSSSSATSDRYQRKEPTGYVVTKTDLAPRVPAVGPLGAITGGPVYHISGTFAPNALLNTASAVIGVDTATDEPNGYPVWVEPFLSGGTHVAKPSRMDFVGTATWSASESPVSTGCLSVDFLVGTGVAVFNNPLPVGLGSLIDAVGTPSPDQAALSGAVDQAVSQAIASGTSDPTVDAALQTVLDGLALPTAP